MTDGGHAAGLEARRIALQAALSDGDVGTLEAMVTDDVVWSVAGQPPWVGEDQVLSSLGRAFNTYDYQFQLIDTRIDSDGDRAVERSNYVSRVAGSDGPVGPPHVGSVVLIWMRTDDWRVAAYLDVGATLFR